MDPQLMSMLLVAALAVLALMALGIAAGKAGADTRPGFGDRPGDPTGDAP